MSAGAAGVELLVCQFPQALALEGETCRLTLAPSPMSCLDEAASKRFAGILIYHSARKMRERQALIELCSGLCENPLTRFTSMGVSLDCRNRELICRLRAAGIEHLDIRLPSKAVDPRKMWERLSAHDCSLKIDFHLARLCPFLHYRPISSQSEMITCKAYCNRMVLGGRRLREVCQTESHLMCEFYRRPRTFP